MSENENFYINLPGFHEFDKLSSDEVYHALPADWCVVITDIEGSTKAISEGRYRDVNTLGAASVAVVQSHFKNKQFPFIFGGDGATFLISPEKIESVRHSLSVLKSYAIEQFGLGLRVGIMKVQQIYKAGYKLEIAKFDIAHGKCTVFIRGGGITWAEDQIKNPNLNLCIEASTEGELDALAGLSCRWQPLPAQRGVMLAILVKPRKPEVLDAVLKKFRSILGGTTDEASPVSQSNMHYKSLWECLKDEWRMTPRLFSLVFAKRLLESSLCIWTFRWGLKELFPAAAYQAEVPSHSDYRKFDDMLRLVLDCSEEQAERIQQYLTQAYNDEQIYYGVRESSHALMTCFVENINPGGHIHFIDGFDGGYALAAKQMKQQMKTDSPD